MKHRICNLLSIVGFILISSSVNASAATVITPPKTGAQPSVAAPSSTSTQSAPRITSPATQAIMPCNQTVAAFVTQPPPAAGVTSVITARPVAATMGPNYVGPTPNITAVANAIDLRVKSLTTQITVRSGLALTKSVGITLDYSSPAAQYHIGPQAYDFCNGNRYLYNDPISGPVGTAGYNVWGLPRQMAINITLTEANPAGQPYVYTIPLKINLDPLFDVTISPMRFTMTTDCDIVGDSEIHFLWYSPDNAKQYHDKNFDTTKGKLVTINEFAFSRQEASASANLFFPSFSFYEYDPHPTSPLVYDIPPLQYKLLPGGSGYVGRHLKDSSGQGGCEADTAFDMTITLHTYTSL